MYQCDERGPHRNAANEVAGAIDRVDDPLEFGIAWPDDAVLFAVQGVVRAFGTKQVTDCRLGVAVELRDFALVGLSFHRKRTFDESRMADRVCNRGRSERQCEVIGQLWGQGVRQSLLVTVVGGSHGSPRRYASRDVAMKNAARGNLCGTL